MSSGHARRTSWVVAPGAEIVPPAPPLPPQQPRYGQQARYALGRVLGFGQKAQNSAEQVVEDDVAPIVQPLTSSNATAVHRTGLEINSLSINESGTHALIAGRQIFKTIRVDGDSCAEDANIRAAIKSYNASVGEHRAKNLSTKETVDIHDVAWAKGTSGSVVAAATYNGPIILYDLNRLGIEMARLFDHRRQVHRVTFNPHAGHYMLSASQDGTVRMWDIRDCQRSVTTITSQRATPGQAEGIRDVKWSPTNGTEFALGTDSGWIQKWDTQMMRTAKVKIAGHATVCSTIDWHPDGKHLLSAGADKAVRVWNVYSEGRRQKPLHEIKVPYPLRNARWRPSFQSVAHGEAGVRQCTQLVTSYDKEYSALHIWDLRRPQLPFRELECYQSAPTDLLWHSKDLLWTVGREGVFTQSDVSYATKTIDKRNAQAFAISPLGELNVVTQVRRPKPHLKDDAQNLKQAGQAQSSLQKRLRNPGDDTLDDNFLSVKIGDSKRRSAPFPESRTSSGTPPSSFEVGKGRILALDTRMERYRISRPRQAAARGILPGPNSALITTFYAQKYKLRPYLYPPTVDSLLNIEQIFEQNAGYAKLASMHRLAQSWRIVGNMLSKDLRQRAEENRRLRLKRDLHAPHDHSAREAIVAIVKTLVANHAGRGSNPPTPLAVPRRLNDLRVSSRESESTMTTPRAYPRDQGAPRSEPEGPDLLDIESEQMEQLPHSWVRDHNLTLNGHGNRGENQTNGQSTIRPTRRSDEEFAPPKLITHDSDDSFMEFPLPNSQTASLTDEDDTQGKLAGKDAQDSGKKEHPRMVLEIPRRADEQPIEDDQATEAGSHLSTSPIDVPIRPKSRSEMSIDMQALVMNNQESFASDTDPSNPNSQKDKIDAPELDAKTQTDNATTRRGERPSTAKPAPHRPQDFDPRFGAFMNDEDQSPDYENEEFIVDDFLRKNPLASTNPLFTLSDMLNELITYHTAHMSDAQSLTALLLLLMPLLPQSSPVPQSTSQQVLASYVEALGPLQASASTQEAILLSTPTRLLLSGLNPLQIESLLATYHDTLLSLSLPINAALLRRLAFPSFPGVYEQALKDNTLSFLCGQCGKPLPSCAATTRCPSCKARPARCPVCGVPQSPFAVEVKSKAASALHRNPMVGQVGDAAGDVPGLWTSCLRCNHALHKDCADRWWAEESGCAVAGCGCECVASGVVGRRGSEAVGAGKGRRR